MPYDQTSDEEREVEVTGKVSFNVHVFREGEIKDDDELRRSMAAAFRDQVMEMSEDDLGSLFDIEEMLEVTYS